MEELLKEIRDQLQTMKSTDVRNELLVVVEILSRHEARLKRLEEDLRMLLL